MRCATAAVLGALICSGCVDGRRDRTVMAWGSGTNPAVVDQLRNETWNGVFDGVMASGCGVKTSVHGVTVNSTAMAACAPLRAELGRTGGEFHVWVGAVPQEVLLSQELRAQFKASAVEQAARHSIAGYSIDDESDCAPRSTLANFTLWVGFINELADELHKHDVQLTAAVQAMFGIQDVPYKPLCQPPALAACSQACHKAPWEYAPNAKVSELMRMSSLDRWLEMDTYYFSTNRFYDTLDYYAGVFGGDRLSHLGVTVMNRKDVSQEGVVARFHAFEKAQVDWLNIFDLPAADQWMPWVKRWKTRCADCPNHGVLSCYEPSVKC